MATAQPSLFQQLLPRHCHTTSVQKYHWATGGHWAAPWSHFGFHFSFVFFRLCVAGRRNREKARTTPFPNMPWIYKLHYKGLARKFLVFTQKRAQKGNNGGRCAGLCFFSFENLPIKLTRRYGRRFFVPRKGRLGAWTGFFIVGGAMLEGARPFKVLVAGPTTLNNFVASTFPLSGFFGACLFFLFYFRFFLPRFRLSVCSKPYARGAARRGDFSTFNSRANHAEQFALS